MQLSEWDEENVILTGSMDGVVRVRICSSFVLSEFSFKGSDINFLYFPDVGN